MEVKLCTYCETEKPLDATHYIMHSNWYWSKRCRACCNAYNKARREKEREKDPEKYLAERRAYAVQYERDYADSIRDRKRQYRKTDSYKDSQKKYQSSHREERNVYLRRRSKIPKNKIRASVGRQITAMLRQKGSSKEGRSFLQHLDWDLNQMQEHITSLFEEWMTWENYGIYLPGEWDDNDPLTWRWQIDHIIPHSTFQYETMDCEEFRACWALSNLRPYSAKQNVLDGVKRIRHKKDD